MAGLLATLNMIPEGELERIRKRHRIAPMLQRISTTPTMKDARKRLASSVSLDLPPRSDTDDEDGRTGASPHACESAALCAGGDFSAIVEQLRRTQADLRETEPPPSFITPLRPYQKQGCTDTDNTRAPHANEGLSWMIDRESLGEGADTEGTLLHPMWSCWRLHRTAAHRGTGTSTISPTARRSTATSAPAASHSSIRATSATFAAVFLLMPWVAMRCVGMSSLTIAGLGKTLASIAIIAALPPTDEFMSSLSTTVSKPTAAPRTPLVQTPPLKQTPPAKSCPSPQAAASPPDNMPLFDQKLKPPCGATLVVCPMSLLSQWQDEIMLHTSTPKQRVLMYYGSDKCAGSTDLGAADIVLTTYGLPCPPSTRCAHSTARHTDGRVRRAADTATAVQPALLAHHP